MSDSVAAQVMAALSEYSAEIAVKVDAAAQSAAKSLKKEIAANSPTMTGEYKKGWKIKQVSKNAAESKFVVYNDKAPERTTWLEFGHAIHGGTERVKAIPHIKPAEQKISEQFAREVDKIIEEAGQ